MYNLDHTQIVPNANLCETTFARINFNDKNELEKTNANPVSLFKFWRLYPT
jgi:hypothetical protein